MKLKTPIIIIVSLIAVIIIAVLGSLFSVTFIDDYILYGEGRVLQCQYDNLRNIDGDGTGYECISQNPLWNFNSIITGNEDSILMNNYCGAIQDSSGIGSFFCDNTASISTIEGFKGRNIRANLQFESNYPDRGLLDGKSSFSILIDNEVVYSSPRLPTGSSDSGLLEINPSIINREEMNIVYKGNIIKEGYVPRGDGKIGFTTTSTTGLTINNFRWKPLFNCEVEADEVIVADEFAPGTKFDIDDLSAVPLKFCLDSYPAVVRSLKDEGVATDIKGEITRRLARGEEITVNEGETIVISYATDFVEGINARCQIGDVYNTRTNKCEDLIFEASDTLRIVRDVVVIAVGQNEAVIKTAGKFGNGFIELSNIKYVCDKEFEEQNFIAPSPRADCWITDIKTPSGDFKNIKTGDVVKVGNYYEVTPLLNAKWETDEDNCHSGFEEGQEGCILGKGDILFKWTNYDAITMSTVPQEPLLILNKVATMGLKVNNKFGVDFSGEQSGFRITETRDLIFGQKRYDTFVNIKQGESLVNLPIDTNELGEVRYDITPFVSIGGADGTDVLLLDNQKVIYTFFVEGKTVIAPDVIVVDSGDSADIKDTPKSKIPLIAWIIIIAFMIITGALVLYRLKR